MKDMKKRLDIGRAGAMEVKSIKNSNESKAPKKQNAGKNDDLRK